MSVRMAAHKIILAIALTAWLPSMAFAMTPGQVYESVKDSVVVVKTYDRQGKPVGHGSGVMLPSGDIITNFHVVKAGERYTVGRGKQAAPATLKAGDPDKDLCLLTAPGLVAEPARLGKAARLKVGDPVYAVGAPQGLELSLSEGIVSQLRGGPPPIIQTTVAISPGSSGGGLFNAKGELVGITTFYLKDSQSLNFAVPVEWIGEVAGRKIRERPIGEAPGAPEPRAKPSDRFTVVKGGVIFDSKTGLEWYVGPDRDTNWNQAKSWTESLTVAGGGWRMPTIPELKAIYQQGAGRNNIDPIFQTTDTWVWSGQMGGSSSFGSPSAGFFGFSHGKWGWAGLGAAVDGRAFAVRSRKGKIRERPRGESPEATAPGAIKRKKDIKIISTKLGDIAFIKGDLFECSVVLNNKIIYENNKLIISFHTLFNELGEYEAILIQESSATRAWFRLILLREDGFIKVTDQFGTGSDYISIDIKSGKTTFKFPNMINKGDVYYIYEKGSLSKVAN